MADLNLDMLNRYEPILYDAAIARVDRDVWARDVAARVKESGVFEKPGFLNAERLGKMKIALDCARHESTLMLLAHTEPKKSE